MATRTLTLAELQLLDLFIERHGRNWKQELQRAWDNPGSGGPVLYALRNSHGPSWLAGFRFFDAVRAYCKERGFTLTKQDGDELRLCRIGAPEAEAYYTGHWNDACGTADAERARIDAKVSKPE